MRRLEISAAPKSLSEYAEEPIDEESLALSTNQTFLDIIERSREQIRAGSTISLEEMKRFVLDLKED